MTIAGEWKAEDDSVGSVRMGVSLLGPTGEYLYVARLSPQERTALAAYIAARRNSAQQAEDALAEAKRSEARLREALERIANELTDWGTATHNGNPLQLYARAALAASGEQT